MREQLNIKPSKYGNVGVLIDCHGIEHVASTQMGESILNTLCNSSVNAHTLHLDETLIPQIKQFAIDRVFIAVPGKYGEDGSVQGMLNILKIPYTGSDVLASALAIDKVRCKHFCFAHKILTPDFQIITTPPQLTDSEIQNLHFPLVVKPIRSGSSIGISYIDQANKLPAAIEKAAAYQRGVMIETYIEGDVYTVSVISSSALPPVYVAINQPIYDYEAKYLNKGSQRGTSTTLSPQAQSRLQKIAEKIYTAIGCKGVARLDFIADNNQDFWFLEINTTPFLQEGHGVAVAAQAAKIPFNELVLNILNETLEEKFA